MMRDFTHPNIVSLIGVCIDGRDVFVVLPFLKYGSVKEYILNPDVVSMMFILKINNDLH